MMIRRNLNEYGYEREGGLITVTFRGVRIGATHGLPSARLIARNHHRRRMDGTVWRVWNVASGSHTGPECRARGTRAQTSDNVMTYAGLCSLLGKTEAMYAVAPSVEQSRMGYADAYRWVWSEVIGGHRFTDMIIARRIDETF